MSYAPGFPPTSPYIFKKIICLNELNMFISECDMVFLELALDGVQEHTMIYKHKNLRNLQSPVLVQQYFMSMGLNVSLDKSEEQTTLVFKW